MPEEIKQVTENIEQPPTTPPTPVPATALGPEFEAALNERIISLNTTLDAYVKDVEAMKKTAEAKQADFIALQGSHDSAVTAYRRLLVNSNPLFTEDLLPGATIPDLDTAAAKILDLANKVRSKIEADIKSVIIPAGAPERSGPDTSGLSAREKIKYAIQEDKK